MNTRRRAARALDPDARENDVAVVERSGRSHVIYTGPYQEGTRIDMQPTQGHEVDIGMSPTMSQLDSDEVGGSKSSKKEKEGGVPSFKRPKWEQECCQERKKVTGDGEPVASTSKSTATTAGGLLPQKSLVPVPFGHVDQAGSKYFGTPLKVNFMTFLAGNQASQQLWYELKKLLGGSLIGVVSDKKDKEDPNRHPAPVTEWTFQVCDYVYHRRKQIPQYFASIKMTVELNKATYFVFKIDNADLAEKYKCTVETLRAAAEVVFVTKILKCGDQNGRRE